MYAIEFFVGSARGRWAMGKKRFEDRATAEAEATRDWQSEARHLGGVYLRRVVLV